MIKWFMGLDRHLRTAIILAPVLAIFGFGLTDLWVKPKAVEQAEQTIAVREMLVSGQCILEADQCKLSGDEMEVALQTAPASTDSLVRLNIASNQHIRGLKMAVVQEGKEDKLIPQATEKTDRWYVEFPRELLTQPSFTLRVALAQTKRVYLAEFPARF
ncbi:MAG: hypothetical protein R3E95_02920 [Thiolinea sp.]